MMTTEQEHRVFGHLLRLTSILMLMQLDAERGHTALGLDGNLRGARQYLMEHCPALLLFTELVYRNQPIPEGLSRLAEMEAVHGRGYGK